MFDIGLIILDFIDMEFFDDTNFFFEDESIRETKIKTNP